MKEPKFMPGELLVEFKGDHHARDHMAPVKCLPTPTFVGVTLIMTILLHGAPTSVTSMAAM